MPWHKLEADSVLSQDLSASSYGGAAVVERFQTNITLLCNIQEASEVFARDYKLSEL